jgi:TonB-dependent siderophore receptor
MTQLRTARAIALAALAAAALSVSAQQPAPSPSPSPEAPRYQESIDVEGKLAVESGSSTATKLAAPIDKVPVSVSLIGASVLQAQDARVLGDALHNVAGVNVASGFGAIDFFTIRGFDSLSSGLVLTDGAGEPEASFYHLYNVGRVEVLRGPAAYLYGGNPLSGTVNLIRKQPASARFGDVRFSGGSFSTYEGTFDGNYAPASGKASFRINGLVRDSDGYRDDKANKVAAVNPSATWRINDRTPLTVNLEYVDSSYKPDVGLPVIGGRVPSVPRTRSYQSPFDRSDQEVWRLRVDFQTGLGRKGTLRNKLYYTDLAWNSEGSLLNGAFPGSPGDFVLVRAFTMLDDRQKLLGNQLEASWNLATGGARHTLLVGLEASRLLDDYTLDVALLPFISVLNPVEAAAPPFQPIPGQSLAGNTRAIVFAPYVADQIAFGDKLQLLAAARRDSVDYEDELTRTQRNEGQWSPMLGLMLSPSPKLSLYGNFGKAFAPPSSLVVGERLPEESRQYETGLKSRLWDGRFALTASAFQIERTHMAIPDQTGVTREQGSGRSKGVEVELQAQLRSDVHAFASYAFTDTELTAFRELVVFPTQPPQFSISDRSGNGFPFAPRNVFNVWAQREPAKGLGVGAGLRYVGRQFIAEDNAFEIDGYWLVDAMISYKLRRATLRLNLKNLTDEKYYTRGFANSAVLPAAPFAAYGSIQIGLGSRP